MLVLKKKKNSISGTSPYANLQYFRMPPGGEVNVLCWKQTVWKEKRVTSRGWLGDTQRHTTTGWQAPAVVPWLWQALFAEVHPHPLTHVSVDLHQAAHGPVTYLVNTGTKQLHSKLVSLLLFALLTVTLTLNGLLGLDLWIQQKNSYCSKCA